MELLHFLHMAGAMASRATLLRYGDEAKHVFMKYSGMALAHRLGPVVGKALAFFAGIGWAWIRWLFATGWRRPLSPVAALHGFSVTLNTEIGAAGTAYEIERTAELVELCAPYTVFRSRLPYAAHLIGRAMLAVPKGHWRVIPPLAERALEILRTDRLTPVSEADRRLAETLVLHVHALAVVFDRGDGAEQLAALEQSSLPMAQVVAHVDRLAHRRWCGFENEAAALERGLDVMLVRIGGAWSMEAEIPVISGMAYGYVRDVVGLKRSIAQLEQFTAAGYRFGRFVDLAYGEYHRERGDLDASRDALERALLGHAEDEGNVRVAATAALAETLLAAGEIARARELAERACELGSDPIVGLVCYRLRAIRALALIDAAEGELARAAERLDSAIVEAEDLGRASIAGDMHDARARVALLAGDRARFRYHALQTERWFRPTDNPVLIARVERLTELSEARPTTARRSRIAEDAVTTVAAPSTVQYLDNTFE